MNTYARTYMHLQYIENTVPWKAYQSGPKHTAWVWAGTRNSKDKRCWGQTSVSRSFAMAWLWAGKRLAKARTRLGRYTGSGIVTAITGLACGRYTVSYSEDTAWPRNTAQILTSGTFIEARGQGGAAGQVGVGAGRVVAGWSLPPTGDGGRSRYRLNPTLSVNDNHSMGFHGFTCKPVCLVLLHACVSVTLVYSSYIADPLCMTRPQLDQSGSLATNGDLTRHPRVDASHPTA